LNLLQKSSPPKTRSQTRQQQQNLGETINLEPHAPINEITSITTSAPEASSSSTSENQNSTNLLSKCQKVISGTSSLTNSSSNSISNSEKDNDSDTDSKGNKFVTSSRRRKQNREAAKRSRERKAWIRHRLSTEVKELECEVRKRDTELKRLGGIPIYGKKLTNGSLAIDSWIYSNPLLDPFPPNYQSNYEYHGSSSGTQTPPLLSQSTPSATDNLISMGQAAGVLPILPNHAMNIINTASTMSTPTITGTSTSNNTSDVDTNFSISSTPVEYEDQYIQF